MWRYSLVYNNHILLLSQVNATAQGHLEIIEYLLEMNANPFIKNAYEDTAYDIAARCLNRRLCEILEEGEREWMKRNVELEGKINTIMS